MEYRKSDEHRDFRDLQNRKLIKEDCPMLGDLAIFYNDQENSILPFVIAPVLQRQDSLILAPRIIADKHDDFINQVYHTMPNTRITFVYLRAFNYSSRVVITITFPSSVRENATNRTGLVFTLGALIEKPVFELYEYPSSKYFTLLLSAFISIFEVDLFMRGANEIINLLNKEKCYPELKNKLTRLVKHLLDTGSTIFSKQQKKRFRFSLHSKKSTKSFPKMIICSHDATLKLYVNVFLNEVDLFLRKHNLSNTGLASESFLNEKSLTLVKLDCLPHEISSVTLKKSRKLKFICIY